MVTFKNKQNTEIIRALYQEVDSRQRFEKTGASGAKQGAENKLSAISPSLKTFYKFFTEIGNAFPDYHLQIDNLVEKGNKVMVRYIIRGTQRGRFMGNAATNEKTDIRGIDVFRVENGRIVYHWNSAYQINALTS